MTNFQQPTEAFLREIDVHELLPQRDPFVMISRLVQFDSVRTVTETDIVSGNIFVENGRFTPSGMIENIAQTCAARLGYVNKFVLNKGIKIGFIGAVRNMEILNTPMVGDMITTIVDVKEEVFGMTLATATVKCNKEVIATTEIKIAIKDS